MNIICVVTCTAGIAYTCIACEKLTKGVKALGHVIKVEIQRVIGMENELQAVDISTVDVVALVVGVGIKGEERFTNERIVRVKTEIVVKSPIQFLKKVEKSLRNE